MLDTDDLALWYALNRLMTNYWADVDYNGGGRAHEFYLPDALYAVGNNRFEGTDKIRAFYARRREHGTTTTRHLVDNLRVFRDDPRHARAAGIMSLYRADGRPPIRVSCRSGSMARRDMNYPTSSAPRTLRCGATSRRSACRDFSLRESIEYKCVQARRPGLQ